MLVLLLFCFLIAVCCLDVVLNYLTLLHIREQHKIILNNYQTGTAQPRGKMRDVSTNEKHHAPGSVVKFPDLYPK